METLVDGKEFSEDRCRVVDRPVRVAEILNCVSRAVFPVAYFLFLFFFFTKHA